MDNVVLTHPAAPGRPLWGSDKHLMLPLAQTESLELLAVNYVAVKRFILNAINRRNRRFVQAHFKFLFKAPSFYTHFLWALFQANTR